MSGGLKMNRYDIVFIGHLGTGIIVPFEGSPFVEQGSPVLFAPIAASCLGKRIAAVTKISESEEYLLEPLKTAGIDLFVEPGEITRYRVVFPTANVDQRQAFLIKGGEHFAIRDIPPFEACLIHLCCMGVREFQLDLMRALKARGFRLSVDMQSFVLQADDETGVVQLKDVPEKKEILDMADFVKLDAMEAKTLTGTEVLQDQADMLEDWGSSETIITSSEGAWLAARGKLRLRNLPTGAPGAGWAGAIPLWDRTWHAGWIILSKTRFASPQRSHRSRWNPPVRSRALWMMLLREWTVPFSTLSQ